MFGLNLRSSKRSGRPGTPPLTRRLASESLESRLLMAADLGLDAHAFESAGTPLFTIGDGVCSSATSPQTEAQPPLDPASADAAFAGNELAGEGEFPPPSSQPPKIVGFAGRHDQGGAWLFTGRVEDDMGVGGLTVMYTWHGMWHWTTTNPDGSFTFALYIGDTFGVVEATAFDSQLLMSEVARLYVDGTET